MSTDDLLAVARSDLNYKNSMRGHFVKSWSAMVERCIDTALMKRIERDPNVSEGELLRERQALIQTAAIAKDGPRYHKLMTGEERKAWEKFEAEVMMPGNYGLPPKEIFPRSTFDWSTWQEAKNQRIVKLTTALSQKGVVTHE